MLRIVRNGLAVIRGLLFTLLLKVFYGKAAKLGKRLAAYRGASLRIAHKGIIQTGRSVYVGKNAMIAVLKKGAIVLGDGVSVGANNMLVCHESITIGENTILAPNVLIYDHDHTFSAENGVDKRNFKTAPVSIGKNCWIGANVVILRGTTIEDNCVVGAGAVLKGHYPKGSLIVQKRETEIRKIQ